MIQIIVNKWYQIVLSIMSVIYGLWMYVHPPIIGMYQSKILDDSILHSNGINWLLIVVGLGTLVLSFLQRPKVEKMAISMSLFLWMTLSVAFLFATPPNAMWIFTLSTSILYFGTLVRV